MELNKSTSLANTSTPHASCCSLPPAGDGEAPANGARFLLDLKKPHAGGSSALAGVRYSVLGLGDSNYTRFMAVPRAIKGRLADLGATVRGGVACCDLCRYLNT